MNTIPVLGVPVLNRGDLLERLILSIDVGVDKLYLINNGNDASVALAIDKIILGLNPLIQEVVVYKPEKNLGVAPSWNRIIQENLSAPYWLIMGSDMMFAKPDAAKQLMDIMNEIHRDNVKALFCGYSAFCITEYGWNHLGSFDENIFPAYLEDSDHHYRTVLSELNWFNTLDVPMLHGEAPDWGSSSTIKSNINYAHANHITHNMNRSYYALKWGGDQYSEKYKHPFNDQSKDVKYWVLDVVGRSEREKVWTEIGKI